jgi:predicted N-acetyltransferase YhbS
MPDMLVRLYDLPDAGPHLERAGTAGYPIRRAEPWDRERLRAFNARCFGDLWAVEADRAFNHTPITAFLATTGPEIAGFAAYECTRRNYFGPTGVREDLRGNGIGAALVLACLHSMREMGYAYAIIGGVGPAAFYERLCGAFSIPGSDVGVYAPLNELRGKETQ